MAWSDDVLDRLAALRLTGCSFDHAWAIVEREYPPRSLPAVWVDSEELGQVSLFDAVDPFSEVESLRDFVKRQAEATWHGERVAPASWRPELLRTV